MCRKPRRPDWLSYQPVKYLVWLMAWGFSRCRRVNLPPSLMNPTSWLNGVDVEAGDDTAVVEARTCGVMCSRKGDIDCFEAVGQGRSGKGEHEGD